MHRYEILNAAGDVVRVVEESSGTLRPALANGQSLRLTHVDDQRVDGATDEPTEEDERHARLVSAVESGALTEEEAQRLEHQPEQTVEVQIEAEKPHD